MIIFNKKTALCITLSTALAFSACNPLGGGTGGESASQRINVPGFCDNQNMPFVVHQSDLSPTNGTETVNVADTITITFPYTPDTAGIENFINLSLWDATSGSWNTLTFSIQANDKIITVVPNAPDLQNSKIYRLQLSSDAPTAIKAAGCPAKYLQLGGGTTTLTSIFSTGTPIVLTYSAPTAKFDIATLEGANGDGLINIAEHPTASIKITLTNDAIAGDTINIAGQAYILTSADINNTYVSFDSALGLNIIDGINNINISDSSGKSQILTVDADLTAPDKPTIISAYDNVGPATGSLISGASTDDDTPEIHANAEPGSTVTIYQDGMATPTNLVVSLSSSQWQFTPAPLATGASYSWTAEATDAAGNTSLISDAFNLTITPPTVISLATASSLALNGDNNNDGIINATEANNTSINIELTGDAAANDTLDVEVNGTTQTITLTTADISAGNVNVPIASANIQDGNNTITAVNATTNLSLNFNADTTPPNKPMIRGADDRSGGVQGNLYNAKTSDETRPVLRGKADAGSTVDIYQDNILVGTTTANTNDKWEYTIPESAPLANNSTPEWKAVAKDNAQNSSNDSDLYSLSIQDPKQKPEVATTNTALLGIVGADVAGLIQLSQQPFAAVDNNDDIYQLRITYNSGVLGLNLIGLLSSLLGFNGTNFAFNQDLADAFGFNIESKALTGLGLLLSDNMWLNITAKDGGMLDNLLLTEFMATVYSDKDLTQLNLLDSLVLKADDKQNNSISSDLAQLLNLGLLSGLLGQSQLPDFVHFVSASSSLDLSSKTTNQRIYALSGDNTITAGTGNDIIRTGAGNDTVNAGLGDDLVEGGGGANTVTTGIGIDTVVFRLLIDDATGGNGVTTWTDFSLNAEADKIDIRRLLPSDANINNIENYLQVSTVGSDTTLSIARDGSGSGYSPILILQNQTSVTLDSLLAGQQLVF